MLLSIAIDQCDYLLFYTFVGLGAAFETVVPAPMLVGFFLFSPPTGTGFDVFIMI